MKTIVKWLLATMLPIIAFVAWYALGFWLPTYRYESSDRGMVAIEIPWKGIGLSDVYSEFERYKKWKGNPALTLLRTERRNWWHPNLWPDNIANERWRIPYAAPSTNVPYGYQMEMIEWENKQADHSSQQADPGGRRPSATPLEPRRGEP